MLVTLVGFTLPSYGYTFDEVLGALLKGECILDYWTHGADAEYLTTNPKTPTYYDDISHPDFYRGARVHRLWQFYALPNTASAVTCRLLRNYILPIDAHHLAIVLVALVGLWYIYRTGWEEGGAVAAIAAFWIVALHPRMFAHLHNNLKDVCVSMLMAATILTFRRAVVNQSILTLLWAGLLTGLAIASKLNAVFIPVIGLPWLACRLLLYRKQVKRRWLIACLFVPVVALAGWCLIEPTYVNDSAQLGEFFRFYSEVAGGGHAHWNWFGLKKFLTCTPPVYLAAFGVGFGWLAWKRRGLDLLFYGWWFALPILRVCVPNAKDCDGIRHYLECLPPFAIVAAMGVSVVVGRVGARLASTSMRRAVVTTLVAAFFVPVAYVDWLYHPHQVVYYNSFVGGYRGAAKHGLGDGDYWCSSYREVIDWILDNDLEPGVIDATYAEHILQYYTVVVAGRQKLVHTPDGDAALTHGGRLYLIWHHDATRKRYKAQTNALSAPPLYEVRRDGRVLVSLHAIDIPKLENHFTINPCRADDQRLKVGHQVGHRAKGAWFVKKTDKRAFMIYGPYLNNLEPGAYSARFDMMLKSVDDQDVPVCKLDVFDSSTKSVLAERVLRTTDFTETGKPQTFDLSFAAPIGTRLEFRVYHEGAAAYGCQRITIVPR